jgi:hypothetical protein
MILSRPATQKCLASLLTACAGRHSLFAYTVTRNRASMNQCFRETSTKKFPPWPRRHSFVVIVATCSYVLNATLLGFRNRAAWLIHEPLGASFSCLLSLKNVTVRFPQAWSPCARALSVGKAIALVRLQFNSKMVTFKHRVALPWPFLFERSQITSYSQN